MHDRGRCHLRSALRCLSTNQHRLCVSVIKHLTHVVRACRLIICRVRNHHWHFAIMRPLLLRIAEKTKVEILKRASLGPSAPQVSKVCPTAYALLFRLLWCTNTPQSQHNCWKPDLPTSSKPPQAPLWLVHFKQASFPKCPLQNQISTSFGKCDSTQLKGILVLFKRAPWCSA